MEKADVLDLERPIKWLNTVESRICYIFCQFHQNSTESQSSLFGHFEQSFGQNIVPKVRTINFFHNIVSQKNFRPKIQIWKKTDCSATYGHTRIKKILHAGNSEMFEGIKNMMVFCGHFFKSLLQVQANSVRSYESCTFRKSANINDLQGE